MVHQHSLKPLKYKAVLSGTTRYLRHSQLEIIFTPEQVCEQEARADQESERKEKVRKERERKKSEREQREREQREREQQEQQERKKSARDLPERDQREHELREQSERQRRVRKDSPPRDEQRRSSPRRSPRQHEPSPSPPASYRALKRSLRGHIAAQAFQGTREGAQQIELLQADIDERDRKYRKYGRW